MARKKPSESVIKSGPLPKSGLQLGNGGGPIDTTTLPRPTSPVWEGWASAPQPRKEDRK